MSSTVKFLFVFCVLVSVAYGRQCHLCGEYRGQYIDCRYPQQTTCLGSCGKEILNGLVKKDVSRLRNENNIERTAVSTTITTAAGSAHAIQITATHRRNQPRGQR
ncbi:hypothetical protein M3Y94_00027200 [Aphelenchoides besseyi]|nr:hypothetical protein M3Y94_00027200 [Aphelenchoides besseyi]